jgi:hypothetical protein
MNTLIDKICFVSEANQPNYTTQFNKKIKSLPFWFDFSYYVSTDDPQSITNTYSKLKIFDIADLQKRTEETKKYEQIQRDSKLFKYPANIRRHIICKAFEDGFNYVVWNDCDVLLKTNEDKFLKEIQNFEINTIYTQNSVYSINKSSNQHPFAGCDRVLSDFNISDLKNRMKIHDGPTAIYYFDRDVQRKYIEAWDNITLYGYQNPYSYQRGAERPPAEVYAVTISDVDIKSLSRTQFLIKHDQSIKY